MDNLFSIESTVKPSMCDFSGRLGEANILDTFMDIAALHAEKLGCGQGSMIMDGKFWLTLKTRVTFYRLPAMNENITVSTWPDAPERIFCIRNYRISRGDETLVLGKTQWAVLNRATGRLDRTADVYPEGVEYNDHGGDKELFETVTDNMFASEPFAEYTVKSTDIDIGGHMNNVAYFRAFQGLFTTEERRSRPLRTLEIQFRNQCFEGETLMFSKFGADGKTFVRLFTGDKTAAYIIIVAGNE